MTNVSLSYDELFAIGDMDAFLTKAKQECRIKLIVNNTRLVGMEYEDVEQEALIKLLDALSKYDASISKLSTFVDRVITNMIRDCIRKASRQKNLMVTYAEQLCDSENTENSFSVTVSVTEHGYENFEFVTDVMENIGLTKQEKRVFELRMRGYSFKEIADELGVTKMRISQVWASIKAKYNRLDS